MQIIGKQVLSSDVAAEIKINHRRLLLTNDGDQTIYLNIEQAEDFPVGVTADADVYFPLAAGEVMSLESEVEFTSVNYICGAGKSSYLRVAAWR